MRSLYCFAAAAVLLSASALPSMATVCSPGDICATTSISPPGSAIGFGSTPFQTLEFTSNGVSFTDYFNFTPAVSGTLTASAIEGTSFGSTSISNFNIMLDRVSDNTVQGFSSTPTSVNGSESLSIGGIHLTGGTQYYIVVQGTTNSSLISANDALDIDGNITLQPTSATPLPGALALFGSALVGFWGVMKRRKARDIAPLGIA